MAKRSLPNPVQTLSEVPTTETIEEIQTERITTEVTPEVTPETPPENSLEAPITTPLVISQTLMIKPRSVEDAIKWINILDHGDSGSGKTIFAGTMIKALKKVLYVAFDEQELLTLDKAKITGYDHIIIKKYEDLWPLYLLLRKNQPGYDGFVLDGLGDFQQEAKDYELKGDDQLAAFMKAAMLGDKRMFLQDWGNLLEMTRHFVVPMLKLPMHKLVTCISEPDEDPKTGKPKIYPGLQGSLKQLIAAKFSVVAYSYIAHWPPNTYWCLTTQPHESILTKDRTRLCRVIINPDFQMFIDALEGRKVRDQTDIEKKLQQTLIVRPQKSKPKVQESNQRAK